MHNIMIKICGIQDVDIAAQAAMMGANFIGLIFHPESRRFVTIAEAREISQAIIAAGATPVAVFVDHTANDMLTICQQTDIQTVQLHGLTARTQHPFLPAHFQRIFVLPVSDQQELQIDASISSLEVARDFILIDHIVPGSGICIDHTSLHYTLPFRWFLAGGLTANNVTTAIENLQPNGVDISSGVESPSGKKDIFLVQQFIKTVRGYSDAA